MGAIVQYPVYVPPVGEHPHLILIDLPNTNQYLTVPGFTKGKLKITETINRLVASGFAEDQVCVHLDNAIHAKPTKKWSPHECTWLTFHFHKPDASFIEKLNIDGHMDAAGISEIAAGLLRLAEREEGLLAPNVVKRLKRLIIRD